MDVVAFCALLTAYIWVVLPGTPGEPVWDYAMVLGAIAIALASTLRHRGDLRELGLRLDNLGPALGVYLLAAAAYAVVVVALLLAGIGHAPARPAGFDAARAAELIGWAALQQFCLLTFLLHRLRRMLGADLPAVLVAAGIFAFFHLPNPFLMLYTLGGGAIIAGLFLRWPSLPAAALAHALASTLASTLLPLAVTGGMRVGPGYWGL